MPTDAPLNNQPLEISVGAAFVAGNKAAATLSAIMLTAWSVYFAARRDLALMAAQTFQVPEDSDMAVGQIVQAMHEKAKAGGLSVCETLSQLESVVLPYMKDLAQRASGDSENEKESEKHVE